VLALALAPAIAAQVQPYGTDDYGGFRNILPPGQSGFDDLAQAAEFKSPPTKPPVIGPDNTPGTRPDPTGRTGASILIRPRTPAAY
jgi:hypothetical protein